MLSRKAFQVTIRVRTARVLPTRNTNFDFVTCTIVARKTALPRQLMQSCPFVFDQAPSEQLGWSWSQDRYTRTPFSTANWTTSSGHAPDAHFQLPISSSRAEGDDGAALSGIIIMSVATNQNTFITSSFRDAVPQPVLVRPGAHCRRHSSTDRSDAPACLGNR